MTFPFYASHYVAPTGPPPAPTVSEIFPPFGTNAGGTAVTITGTGFNSGGLTGITIGGNAVTSLVIVSGTSATAVTAAHATANSDVIVTGPGGSNTLTAGYTFMPPSGWTLALFGDNGLVDHLGNVTAWNDQSGAGNDFAPVTAPTSIAGPPRYAEFDGSTTSMIAATPLSDFMASDGSAYSLYVVCLPTSANAGAPEVYDAFIADSATPSTGAFGYFEFGVTSAAPSNGSDAVVSSVYPTSDIVTDSGGGVDFTHILLGVVLLDQSTGINVEVNDGTAYAGAFTGAPGDIGFVGNYPQLGATASGGPTYTGNLYAVFMWNRRLLSAEDTVVRTFFKNWYAIPSWSGAPSPTVTLVTPNVGSSAGGWAITITGTNFTGATSVTIAGQPCTSVVVVSPTEITAIAPAYSTPNGSTTGQTVTVTTPAGSGSGSGVAAEYFYLPSNNAIVFFHRSDVGVTTSAGTTTGIADQSGNGVNLAVTGTAPAAPAGNFSGSGLPYIAFDGASNQMAASLASALSDGELGFFWAGNVVTPGELQVPITVNDSGTQDGVATLLYMGSFMVWSGSNQLAIASYDSNPHTFGINTTTSAATAQGFVDATSASGNIGSLYAPDTLLLGSDGASGFPCQFNWVCDLAYAEPPSSGDIATVMSILKQTCGTP